MLAGLAIDAEAATPIAARTRRAKRGKAKGGKGAFGGQQVQKPAFDKYRNDGGKGPKGKGKGFKANDKNKGYKGRW